MSNPLLALFTCFSYDYDMRGMVCYPRHPKRDRRPAIKQTWLNDVDIPYRWFFGQQSKEPKLPQHDEVFLPCPDGYYDNARKAQAIARWALSNGYDRVFKVDDDTYVHWDRLKQRPLFSTGEYGGGCWDVSKFAYGGAYMWSGRLLEAIATTPLSPTTWADDTWIGLLAASLHIPLVRDDTFHFGRVNPHTEIQGVEESVLQGNEFTVLNPLTPEQMLRYHNEIR